MRKKVSNAPPFVKNLIITEKEEAIYLNLVTKVANVPASSTL
ncbi:MAG: hypothetical protein SNJ78_09935 [Spirochaetales bacterium]